MAFATPEAAESAKQFCTNHIRPFAQFKVQRYWQAKEALARWNQKGYTAIFATESATVIDDSVAPALTGAMVLSITPDIAALITEMEANSNAKLNTFLALIQ